MSGGARRRAQRHGRVAEWLCVWSLRLRGWQVLARGFSGRRGSGAGEIDIVARRGAVLAFIEVKARPDAATAVLALGARQRGRILRGAEAFLQVRPQLADLAIRFDLMLVTPGRLPRHLFDAWRPGG